MTLRRRRRAARDAGRRAGAVGQRARALGRARTACASAPSPTPARATKAITPTSASRRARRTAYAFLRETLSAKRVHAFYQDLVHGPVVRYELPNLLAFNFMLHNALGGGGTLSLRVDHQGKTLAQGLLTMEIDVPDDVLASVGA